MKKILPIIPLILFIFSLNLSNPLHAQTTNYAEMYVQPSQTSVHLGDTIDVIVGVNLKDIGNHSQVLLNGYEIYLTYDHNILQLNSNSKQNLQNISNWGLQNDSEDTYAGLTRLKYIYHEGGSCTNCIDIGIGQHHLIKLTFTAIKSGKIDLELDLDRINNLISDVTVFESDLFPLINDSQSAYHNASIIVRLNPRILLTNWLINLVDYDIHIPADGNINTLDWAKNWK